MQKASPMSFMIVALEWKQLLVPLPCSLRLNLVEPCEGDSQVTLLYTPFQARRLHENE